MATQTQLGMTINARNLELMLRRLAALPLAEANEYSEKLYEATKDTAPSLIRYTQATDYDKFTRNNLRRRTAVFLKKHPSETDGSKKLSAVQLAFVSPSADNKVAAALLFSSSDLNYSSCLNQANQMTLREKKVLFKTAFEHLQAHDAVLRELENVDLQFELIVSASCFAQLKRHPLPPLMF
jgi:thymidylate synthase ThyX